MNLSTEYLILALLVFGMNVVPALMPPTWIILLFFYLRFHLALLPTVVIGALSATSGRIILALLASHFRPLLHKKSRRNMATLGQYFNSHMHLTIPLVITYAFLPIPSNHVYIAAGLARVNLKILAMSFLIGRLVSYSLWLTVTHRIVSSLDKIFHQYYAKPTSFVLEVIGFILLYLTIKIDWGRIIRRIDNRR